MATSWKIFRIANLVEIILSASVIVFILCKPGGISTSRTDLVFFFVFCAIVLLLAANCVSNILLLRYYSSASVPGFGRKFFFWCITVLFFLIVAVLLLGIVMAMIELSDKAKLNYPQYTRGTVIGLIWGGVIGLNGLYIVIAQVILFYRIRKNHLDSAADLLTEIGVNAL